MHQAIPRPRLVVDGEAVAGHATYPVYNPAHPDELVLEAPTTSAEQLDQAVAAARRAHAGWAAMDFDERAQALQSASAAVAEAVKDQELDRLLSREHGKVLWEATFDAGTLGGMSAAFVPLARAALERRVLPTGSSSTEVEVAPVGVVVAILPFNWPVSVLGNKLIPALLTGNTVVVKPPPTCPGAVLEASWALAHALPAGVVNVVNGPDAALGSALVEHPGVDMVSFTGGVPTGRAVMSSAGQHLHPVVLELGGNDPAIIAPDVEITEELADSIVTGSFVTSGQVCMAIKRVYVAEPSLPALVDALVERTGREVVGDGLVPEVTMGPVHRPSPRDRVEEMIAEAEEAGTRVHRPARIDESASPDGYFVSPAIVENPPPDARIVREEQFAPALPVIGYRDVDDAVAQANDSRYGLCASVWTGDDELADAVVSRLQAGTVFVNTHGIAAMDHRAPFGGWKDSGVGLELGTEGMSAFTRPRTVLRHRLPTS
jgi:acyl-CoA reductase-like NAD-dependent aldehyde dehydrogenase